jgi:lysophospholipase L1-like esterase
MTVSKKLMATLLGLTFAAAPALADPFRFGVAGDSLSDPYAHYTRKNNPNSPGLPLWGFAGDMNWAEQLRARRPRSIVVEDQAHAGATSADLLAQGQDKALATLVAHDNLRHAVIMIGANDILAQLQKGGDPAPALAALGQNVQQAINTLRQAGPVKLVLANIPDLAATPLLQATSTPQQLAGITALVQAANHVLNGVAVQNGLPVLDLFKLGELTRGPLTLAGQTFQPGQLFTPDLFHPATPLQGLVANAYLGAEHRAYGTDIASLRISDREIASLALHAPVAGGATYFNVNGFVNFSPNPEPPTLVLCGLAGLVGAVGWGRRRRVTAAA